VTPGPHQIQDQSPTDVSPAPRPPGKSRVTHHGFLTVTGSVVFSPSEGPPHSAGQPQSILLLTDERPFSRPHFKVGPAWRPLELGWFDSQPPSYLVLENHRVRFDLQPTPEEVVAAESLVVEVALAPAGEGKAWGGVRTMHSPPRSGPEPFALVRPGRDLRFEPSSVGRIILRCPAGEAACSLHLFPR
jgi:hypothetical protein